MQLNPFEPHRTGGEEQELVCFCFHYTRQEIEQEYRIHNHSTILDSIVLAKKTGGCDCMRLNPRGR